LLTNKTIYPMHRTLNAYKQFNEVKQLVNVLNYAVERETNLFRSAEFKKTLNKVLKSQHLS
jgi:hypothetical protein